MSRPLDERGQSLVEAAVALPVLLLLFMGLLQMIAWGWASVLCTHAAQAAVRVYSVRHADDEVVALRMAQDTAERILIKAWPSVLPKIDLEEADPGECRLHLSAMVYPLWGWHLPLSHSGMMFIERIALIQDEATDARRQEDAFK